ncbi:MAG: hypothetical protein KatS3mg003_1431 [Candidatus Nitrosocaldaceae archaeon]|nr:MAG: hypothetical protein KatS3mg003_1431 [Candidatus Nitrosocaldaceae archaeon]
MIMKDKDITKYIDEIRIGLAQELAAKISNRELNRELLADTFATILVSKILLDHIEKEITWNEIELAKENVIKLQHYITDLLALLDKGANNGC